MDLTEFLLARIAEDEQVARAATPGPWYSANHAGDIEIVVADGYGFPAECGGASDAAHIAHWDPARVLAECAAKRGLIEYARPDDADLEGALADHADDPMLVVAEPIARAATQLVDAALAGLLRYLAFAYADHPGYNPEWKP